MTDDAEPAARTGRPPTFTSWLRKLSDSELASLFAARPDLITPVPADLGALAARCTSRPAALRSWTGSIGSAFRSSKGWSRTSA
ncbi:hypothetical protein [Allosalinactinospora lopnorensis]|uniref:hypothetical protein n=1 Tax=Allosalinactinospora lopnorensis TaxID=1352348 RepID=UPI000A64AE96